MGYSMWALKKYNYNCRLLKQTNKNWKKFCQNVSLCYKRSKVYIDLHTRRAVKIPYSVKICSSVSFGHTFQPHGLC